MSETEVAENSYEAVELKKKRKMFEKTLFMVAKENKNSALKSMV